MIVCWLIINVYENYSSVFVIFFVFCGGVSSGESDFVSPNGDFENYLKNGSSYNVYS